MAVSKYQNFKEYSERDTNYFTRALMGELHRQQAKITFRDGTTYHVTRSGSRYWHRGNYLHREDGPAGIWSERDPGSYYLFSVAFEDREQHERAVKRLNLLREQSNGELEKIVDNIARNTGWEDRCRMWRTILSGSSEPSVMLEALVALSTEYAKLSEMTRDFARLHR